jgi:hypothetical protein
VFGADTDAVFLQDVLAVGDVQSPRTIEEAVLEGLRAGVAI